MQKLGEVRRALDAGELDGGMAQLRYGGAAEARAKVRNVLDGFERSFGAGPDTPVALCSAPGRTEICGNHTDHQHGRVLAGAVDVDFLACAAKNGTSKIRFQSEGWPMVEVELDELIPKTSERESTAALVRGMAGLVKERGFDVSGFDVYAASEVLPGSGLSSSAACEVLLGVIENRLFCGDALDAVTIAQLGQRAENVYFGKPSGLMDQTASSVGGAVAIDFADPASPIVRSVKVDLEALGYALCIIDSGASHAALTGEYASIPEEMGAVAEFFGKKVLREVDEAALLRALPELRKSAGDRAVLRALHFFADDRRAAEEADALERGDMDAFLALVRESGRSSWELLQNITPTGASREQAMAVALTVAGRALGGRGACRVHGGGFAGTIQAFVPLDMLEGFQREVEAVLGKGSCKALSIRPVGGTVLWP
ncbi:MAG TPA: galactokinase [Candidatus Scatomorpha pullistercoris]|uniref:Galactokinase n=1 Tax=Candidatus Scatomorpha pullistercoris TaxID=2840929 RepID=A0A9D1G429_9FIRM|nr:galactokinase [Candidatus Scatomorpha pullistercoris]